MNSNIILLGFQNVGKSTIGRALADRLSCPFYDTDKIIEDLYFRDEELFSCVREIHSREGEARFRALEFEALQKLEGIEGSVISTGGGVLVGKGTYDMLEVMGPLVCLHLDPEQILERYDESPSYFKLEEFHDSYAARMKLFERPGIFWLRADQKDILDKLEELAWDQTPSVVY